MRTRDGQTIATTWAFRISLTRWLRSCGRALPPHRAISVCAGVGRVEQEEWTNARCR